MLKSLPKEFRGKTGKFDYKNFDYTKFKHLDVSVRRQIVKDSIKSIQDYLRTGKFTEETREAGQVLAKINDAKPEYGLGVYAHLVISKYKGYNPRLTKDMLTQLQERDPTTFEIFTRNGGKLQTTPNSNGESLNTKNTPENQVIEKNPERVNADSDIHSINTSMEPTEGVLSNKPIDTASPAGPSSGALTDQPAKLPEVGNQPELPNVGKTIKEAEANAYTGKEPPIADYNTPITPPGVHVSFIDADGKPVDLTPEEIVKFKPNSASPAPSPEAIGEAMRDAIKDRVGNTQLNPEDIPAFLVKEKGEVKTAEETAKTETAAETKTPETAKEGASTGKPDEPSKGVFGKTWDFLRKHPKLSLGLGIPTGLGIIGGIGITQADKIAEALKAGRNVGRDINEEPVTSGSANYRVWENYNPDYLNEEYVPGEIPSHIPQDNLAPVKESTISKKVKNRPQQQKQQPQVINAPENNATADYVRAAYNSYIPSDAGRAYQKAIYGDPLELERNRQQQKWRDFVMRSGQSPAELVQRGLMPYDALQYV